jgi:hypothetical protein
MRILAFVLLTLGISTSQKPALAQTAAFPLEPPPAAAPPPSPPPQAAPAAPPAWYPPQPAAPVPAVAHQAPAPPPQQPAQPPYQVERPRSPRDLGYRLEVERNGGLMAAGIIAWGIGYGGGLIYLASADAGESPGWMFVPVVGPVGALASRDFDCSTKIDAASQVEDVDLCVDEGIKELRATTAIALSGVLQLVGSTLLLAGVLDERQRWVPTVPGRLTLQVGPVRGGHGLTFSGRF